MINKAIKEYKYNGTVKERQEALKRLNRDYLHNSAYKWTDYLIDMISNYNNRPDKHNTLKLLTASIKVVILSDYNSNLSLEDTYRISNIAIELLTDITYKEFMDLYPITKAYNTSKDYFETMKHLQEYNLNDKIASPYELLAFYNNTTTEIFFLSHLIIEELLLNE